MRQQLSTLAAATVTACMSLLESLRTLITFDAKPYRPEKFYMRGPGPAWHHKHPGGSVLN